MSAIIIRKIPLFFLLVCFTFTNAEEEEGKEPKMKYSRPTTEGVVHFAEPFHDIEEFGMQWKVSEAKKDGVDESISKYEGKWSVAEPKDNPLAGDNGLIYSSEAKHGAISAPLTNTFKFEERPLVIQYEVRFQKKHECGGAYIKLLADTANLKFEEFTDKTEYTIMFGPDKCGTDGKLHFIFQHKNPLTFKMEEKHAKKPFGEFTNIFDDGKTHLVGLIVRPDNTFEIQVDKVVVNSGSLLKDMEPPVNPEKLIDDPEDTKPEDWDEREKITDPNAVKPDDWDEDAPQTIEDANAVKPDGWLDDASELVADPAAVKPEDWDDEEDGEWEAPQIPNPACKTVGCGEWKRPTIPNPNYKGKWSAPLIDNPAYKGVWKAKQIENPHYFEDNNPFLMKPIAAVGYEIWSMQSDIVFDNIIIADDLYKVNQWTSQTWDIKRSNEGTGKGDLSADGVSGLWNSLLETTKEKPWIWAIVFAAVLLPIIMIYLLCCTGGGKNADAARYKKTDEVLPDDEPTEAADVDEGTENSTVTSEPEGKEEETNVEEVKSEEATKVEEVKSEEAAKVEEVKSEEATNVDEAKSEDIEEKNAAVENSEETIVPQKDAECFEKPDDTTQESEDLSNGNVVCDEESVENVPSVELTDSTSGIEPVEEKNMELCDNDEELPPKQQEAEEHDLSSSKDEESVEDPTDNSSEITSPPDSNSDLTDPPASVEEVNTNTQEEVSSYSPKTRAGKRKTRKDT